MCWMGFGVERMERFWCVGIEGLKGKRVVGFGV
jgi:hypothetical protein